MSKLAAESKGYWALDTDWLTAVLSGFFFLFCLLALATGFWRVLTGAPVATHITWKILFLLLVSVWLTVRAVRHGYRTAQFAFGLLSLSFGSRIILAVLHVSVETQILNADVMRVLDLLVMAGFCIYFVSSNRGLVRRIPDTNVEKTRE
jgi:hypothetical protein